MTLGCFADIAGRISSTIGLAASSSMSSNSASTEDALVAGLVDTSPFSTIGVTTWLRERTQFSLPPNLRNAQNAAMPSDCAATLESATAPFHRLGSWLNGRNAGSCSSGVSSNCFAASSYACLRAFQTYGFWDWSVKEKNDEDEDEDDDAGIQFLIYALYVPISL